MTAVVDLDAELSESGPVKAGFENRDLVLIASTDAHRHRPPRSKRRPAGPVLPCRAGCPAGTNHGLISANRSVTRSGDCRGPADRRQ